MTSRSPKARDSRARPANLPLLYLLLVILPLAVAGVSGHLVRHFEVRNLAVLEAGRMARAALAVASAEGPQAALRALEGAAGYEVAFYEDGVRTVATDPGFGPDSLGGLAPLPRDADAGDLVVDLSGRLGALAAGSDRAALAAATRLPAATATYPGGWIRVSGLILAVALVGLAVVSRAPGTFRAALAAAVPLAVSWMLLLGAARQASTDADRASARRVGLAAALAQDAGPGAPLDYLSRVTGLRVARLGPQGVIAASWDQGRHPVSLEGLPRPPLGRTITGYLSNGDEELRYGASRTSEETVVFLAPAPARPPPGVAVRLLLLGWAISGAAVAFVALVRGRSSAA